LFCLHLSYFCAPFFLQWYESKDRNLQFEQRKAFQRLLYVSQVGGCVERTKPLFVRKSAGGAGGGAQVV
jgi:hypothetical protein